MVLPLPRMKKLKRGQTIAITFVDHSEGMELRRFTAIGRVLKDEPDAITLQSWGDADSLEPDESTQEYTIAKPLVREVRKLTG